MGGRFPRIVILSEDWRSLWHYVHPMNASEALHEPSHIEHQTACKKDPSTAVGMTMWGNAVFSFVALHYDFAPHQPF